VAQSAARGPADPTINGATDPGSTADSTNYAGLAATTLAAIAGHTDPGFTLRCHARDGRDPAELVSDVLERAAGAGFGR
jgi:hypothetical protein